MTGGILSAILIVALLIGLFLLMRKINLWYFRINEMHEKTSTLIMIQTKIAEKQGIEFSSMEKIRIDKAVANK